MEQAQAFRKQSILYEKQAEARARRRSFLLKKNQVTSADDVPRLRQVAADAQPLPSRAHGSQVVQLNSVNQHANQWSQPSYSVGPPLHAAQRALQQEMRASLAPTPPI